MSSPKTITIVGGNDYIISVELGMFIAYKYDKNFFVIETPHNYIKKYFPINKYDKFRKELKDIIYNDHINNKNNIIII